MKFLKTQNTSKFLLKDNQFKSNPYGRYTMDGTGGVRLPKGTTAQRPQLSGVEMPNGANGMLRYNTTNNTLECFIAGYWEVVGAASSTAITRETYGPGDYIEEYFGPLPAAFEGEFLSSVGGNLDNIIVLVENVWQIAGTNFIIEQNPAGNSSPTSQHAGAPYSSVDGRTDPTKSTWWLKFNPEPPPLGKNVTVYFGYAN
jgi:hypothetical protein